MKNIKVYFSLFIVLLCFPLKTYAMSASAQANLTAALQGATGAINVTMGIEYASSCPPHNYKACALAVAHFAAAGLNLLQMSEALSTRDNISSSDANWGSNFTSEYGTTSDTAIETIGSAIDDGSTEAYNKARDLLMKEAEPYLSKLAEMGYNADMTTGTATGPNGSALSSSLLAGSASEMDALMEKARKALGGVMDTSGGGGMIAADTSGAGAGYGSGRSVASDSGRKSGVDDFLNKLKDGKVDEKISGLSKGTADGDRIGVAMNNIFKMIQEKYSNIDRQQGFLEGRAKASK